MDRFIQDVRFGLRSLRWSPGFTAVAVITLALGIGANTAIFGLLDQVLLRTLPVADPEGLVMMSAPGPQRGSVWSDGSSDESFSYQAFRTLRDNNEVLGGLAARHPISVNISTGGEPERAQGELVSGNYFDVLGVRPAMGRMLTWSDESAPGGDPVIVLSHGYWASKFGGNPAILNQRILVNGQPFTVVGVAQPNFNGIQVGRLSSFFLPVTMQKIASPGAGDLLDYSYHWLHLFGRLKPGVAPEAAQAGIQGVYRRTLEEQVAHFRRPPSESMRAQFMGKQLLLNRGAGGRETFQRNAREPLFVVMGMALLVLVIAVFNLANLLVTRGTARARQYSIRAALGATRWHLVRAALVEAWLLFAAGAGLAVLVALWLTAALVSTMDTQGSTGLAAQLNWRVLTFNFVLAFLAGTAAGLAPALRRDKVDLATALKGQGAGSSVGISAVRFRRVLIAGEVALTLLLFTAAALFVRTLDKLYKVPLGLNPSNVAMFTIAPELNGYDQARSAALLDQLRNSIATIPGVQMVTHATIPAFTDSTSSSNYSFQGYQAAEDENTTLSQNWVGPNYFSTLAVPLLRGREFNENDGAPKTQQVAVISESTARRFFPNIDPIGARVALGAGSTVEYNIVIVGIVKDARHATVREDPRPFIYLPFRQQENLGGATFYVRTTVPMETLGPALRQAMRKLDPNIPIENDRMLPAAISDSLSPERMIRNLAIAFGGVAALLAGVGLYGLLAYTVVLRTREIGIRVALGASRRSILVGILRQGLVLIGIGIAIGLPVVVLAGRGMRSLLYQVSAVDAISIAGAVLLLSAIGALASYIPALRATKVDPMVALRYE